MRRLSRGCYDKFHRCPGWAGGGPKYAKTHRCNNGKVQVDYEDKLWTLKFHRCNFCNVLVLPYFTRWLSLWFWAYEISFWWRYRNDR